MRASVAAALPGYLEQFEGRVRNMYLDNADPVGLVTVGIGSLIDPMSAALMLPWVHKLDGTNATRAEIVTDWNTVKGAQALKRLGGGHFAQLTKLCLTDDCIDDRVRTKVARFEALLRGGFPTWDQFPAAAQLGVLDMAYNMGPRFGFPHFRAAANAHDWATCADECKIVDAPQARNDSHDRLFRFAAAGGDPDGLPV